jgi:DNA-directed RNA polymerase specialized sigma24 family protein
MARGHWDSYAVQVAREMGYQWRRRYLGDVGGEIVPPGHATRSVLGKIREEGLEGAGQAFARQHFPEFYTGLALEGRRVLHGLRDHDRVAITMHFYGQGLPVKQKAHALDWAVRTYWRRLDRGMDHFASGLRSDVEWHKIDPGQWHITSLEFAISA